MTYQAGRDLDVLVAEKVMGLIPIQETFESHHNGDAVTVTKWCLEDGKQIGEYGFCPRYSTSIEAAWEVVEKITTDFTGVSSKGFGIGFKMEYRTEMAGPNYRVTLVETSCAPPFEEMRDICTVVAGTAPLAICLAALKVVGA